MGLLCCLLLFQLAFPAKAAGSVYFVAAEESVLPVTDATMPFWANGYLYVPALSLIHIFPAQNRGESEEEQADSHELGAEAGSHHGAEGGLGQIGLAEHGGHIPHIAVCQLSLIHI